MRLLIAFLFPLFVTLNCFAQQCTTPQPPPNTRPALWRWGPGSDGGTCSAPGANGIASLNCSGNPTLVGTLQPNGYPNCGQQIITYPSGQTVVQCNNGGGDAQQFLCPDGYAMQSDGQTCVQNWVCCPGGSWALGSSLCPVACPDGSYANSPGLCPSNGGNTGTGGSSGTGGGTGSSGSGSSGSSGSGGDGSSGSGSSGSGSGSSGSGSSGSGGTGSSGGTSGGSTGGSTGSGSGDPGTGQATGGSTGGGSTGNTGGTGTSTGGGDGGTTGGGTGGTGGTGGGNSGTPNNGTGGSGGCTGSACNTGGGGTGQPPTGGGCVGTACNTGGGNGGGGNGSGTPDSQNLCQLNPQLNICNNSTVQASCSGGVSTVTCTGDAVECQIAKATADADCREAQDEADLKGSTIYQTGQQISQGNDPLAGQLPTPGNAATVDVGTIQSNGWLGVGSCFKDIQFNMLGQSVTVPMQPMCDYLVALRFIIMALAGIASFRMMQGTFLQG